uniref:Small tegument protein n=1 Tax=Elephant endotheliotropic herpesvirus 1A TaxID=759753 RepID=A0A866VUG4_ELHV1|nr:small tegument protein [Elephant endotheliotropic herpesvirus 1A]
MTPLTKHFTSALYNASTLCLFLLTMSAISLETVAQSWSLIHLNRLEVNGVLFGTVTADGLSRLSQLAQNNGYSFIATNTLYYVFNHSDIEGLDVALISEIISNLREITPVAESECPNICDSVVLGNTKQCLINFASWYASTSQSSVYSFQEAVSPINHLRNTRFHNELLSRLYNIAHDKIVQLTIHNVLQPDHTDMEKILRTFFIFKHGLVTAAEAEQFRAIASRCGNHFMREMTSMSSDGQLSAWYTREPSFCVASKALTDEPYADLIFPLMESSVSILQNNIFGVDSILFHPGLIHYLCTVDLVNLDIRYRQAITRFLVGRLETIVKSLNLDRVTTLELLNLSGLSDDVCLQYLRMIKRRPEQDINVDIVVPLTNLLVHCFLISKMLTQPPNTYQTYLNVVQQGHKEILYGGLICGDMASDMVTQARGVLRACIPRYTQEEFKLLIRPTNKTHTIRYLLTDIMTKWTEFLFSVDDIRHSTEQHPGVTGAIDALQDVSKTQDALVTACTYYKNTGTMDGLVPHVREGYFASTIVEQIILPILSDLFIITPNILRVSGNQKLLDLILLSKILLPMHIRLINLLSVLQNFLNLTSGYDLNALTFFNNIVFDLKDVLLDILRDDREIILSDNISNFILQSAARNVFNDIDSDLELHVNDTINFFNQHIAVADLLTLIGMCKYDISWYKGTVTIDLGEETAVTGLRPFIEMLKTTLIRYDKSEKYMLNIIANLETSCQKLLSFITFLDESVDDSPGVTFYKQYANAAVTRIYQLKNEVNTKVGGLADTHKGTLYILRKLCTMCNIMSNEAIESTNLKVCLDTFRRDILQQTIPTTRNTTDQLPSFCVERQVRLFHDTFGNNWEPTQFKQMESAFVGEDSSSPLNGLTAPFLNLFDSRYAMEDPVMVRWNVFTNEEFSTVASIFLGRAGTHDTTDDDTDDGGVPYALETIVEEDEDDTSSVSSRSMVDTQSARALTPNATDRFFAERAKNLSVPGLSATASSSTSIPQHGLASLDGSVRVKQEKTDTRSGLSGGPRGSSGLNLRSVTDSAGRSHSAGRTLTDYIDSLSTCDDSLDLNIQPPSILSSTRVSSTPSTQMTSLSTNYAGSTLPNTQGSGSQSFTILSGSSGSTDRPPSTIVLPPSGLRPLTTQSTQSTQQTSVYGTEYDAGTMSTAVPMASVQTSISYTGGLSVSDILRSGSSSAMSITSNTGGTRGRRDSVITVDSGPSSLIDSGPESLATPVSSHIGHTGGRKARPLSATPTDTCDSASPLVASPASSIIGRPGGRKARRLSETSVDSGPSALNTIYSGPLTRPRSKSVSEGSTVSMSSEYSRAATPIPDPFLQPRTRTPSTSGLLPVLSESESDMIITSGAESSRSTPVRRPRTPTGGRRSVRMDVTMSTASESEENSLPFSDIGDDPLSSIRRQQRALQATTQQGPRQIPLAPQHTHQTESFSQLSLSSRAESPFNLDAFTKFLDDFPLQDTTSSSGAPMRPRSVEMRNASDTTVSDGALSDDGRRSAPPSSDSESTNTRGRFPREYYSLM